MGDYTTRKSTVNTQESNNMELTVTINLTFDELRAVIKSVSIGCDQLTKKLERVGSSKWQSDVHDELTLLTSANAVFSERLVNALKEMNYDDIV
jgi:hypothetical protein